MIKNNKKGFTLIELLVVIAIIGILSGTVIVSMSGAQDSAKNARIEAGMDQLRSAAEVYRLLKGTYVGFTTEGDGLLIKNDIAAAGGDLTVNPSATAYCMSSKLNGSSDFICMDSKGKVGTKDCGSLFACPD